MLLSVVYSLSMREMGFGEVRELWAEKDPTHEEWGRKTYSFYALFIIYFNHISLISYILIR